MAGLSLGRGQSLCYRKCKTPLATRQLDWSPGTTIGSANLLSDRQKNCSLVDLFIHSTQVLISTRCLALAAIPGAGREDTQSPPPAGTRGCTGGPQRGGSFAEEVEEGEEGFSRAGVLQGDPTFLSPRGPLGLSYLFHWPPLALLSLDLASWNIWNN